jgi:replicative DNA helicase
MTPGRVPPHNLDAERSLLGGILLDNDALGDCSALVRPEDFYVPAYCKVWGAMVALDARGQPVDRVTVIEELRRNNELREAGGAEMVEELDKSVPIAANLLHYARIVADKAQARALIRTTGELHALAYEHSSSAELLDEAEKRIMAIRGDRDRSGGFVHVKPVLASSFKMLEERYERGDAITGLATGLADFDRMTSGLQPGDLVILAARPSMGKTAMALDWLREITVRGKFREQRCAGGIFSLEMPKDQLVLRMLSAESSVDSGRMRSGQLIESDWSKLAHACGPIADAQLHIDDTAGLSLSELRARARRLAQRYAKTDTPLRLLVVDYLQLMGAEQRGRGARYESREQEVAQISKGLKQLAKELAIPIVALSQLSRKCEERKDKRPLLSDLRESGSIEQDADLVVFLFRQEVYEQDNADVQGKAELIISKQRNGAIGTAHVAFVSHMTSFRNLQQGGDH